MPDKSQRRPRRPERFFSQSRADLESHYSSGGKSDRHYASGGPRKRSDKGKRTKR